MNANEVLAHEFEQQRNRLTALAFRMLGSSSEAEDAVQEAWLRLSHSDAAAIENLGAWLTTVVSRVCLNVLQSRRARPQVPLSPDPRDAGAVAGLSAGPGATPEPEAGRDGESDPEHEALLADSVGLALLVVLDTLNPAERVAFVLHDLFGISFDEIASVVGREPAAARQLASRARRRLRGQEPTPNGDRLRQARLVDAFLSATRNGDFAALLAVLDPDIELHADAASVAHGAPEGATGAEAVAAFLQRARGARAVMLDGEPAAAWVVDDRPRVIFRFTVGAELITGVELIGDPDRIAALAPQRTR